MIRRFQAAILLLLFALSSVSGQDRMLQCLCSGKIMLSSAKASDCPLCPQANSGEADEHCGGPCGEAPCLHNKKVTDPRHEERDPCQDGDCFVVILAQPANAPKLFKAERELPPALELELPPYCEAAAVFVKEIVRPPAVRTPVSGPVPLTVLYSSFLI